MLRALIIPACAISSGMCGIAERLERAFAGVTVVVHAAAIEAGSGVRVQPVRSDPDEHHGRPQCDRCGHQPGREAAMLALSTDKAVNPINLYGATKLCAEKMFVQANAYAGGQRRPFCLCPLRQRRGQPRAASSRVSGAAQAGKITITDPRMTRFWITLDRGVRFVIRCIERDAWRRDLRAQDSQHANG